MKMNEKIRITEEQLIGTQNTYENLCMKFLVGSCMAAPGYRIEILTCREVSFEVAVLEVNVYMPRKRKPYACFDIYVNTMTVHTAGSNATPKLVYYVGTFEQYLKDEEKARDDAIAFLTEVLRVQNKKLEPEATEPEATETEGKGREEMKQKTFYVPVINSSGYDNPVPVKGTVGVLTERTYNGRDSSPFDWTLVTSAVDKGGIPGNANPAVRRYHGWRGTTSGISVYAHGVRKVTKVRFVAKAGNRYGWCGGGYYAVTVGRDLFRNTA